MLQIATGDAWYSLVAREIRKEDGTVDMRYDLNPTPYILNSTSDIWTRTPYILNANPLILKGSKYNNRR